MMFLRVRPGVAALSATLRAPPATARDEALDAAWAARSARGEAGSSPEEARDPDTPEPAIGRAGGCCLGSRMALNMARCEGGRICLSGWVIAPQALALDRGVESFEAGHIAHRRQRRADRLRPLCDRGVAAEAEGRQPVFAEAERGAIRHAQTLCQAFRRTLRLREADRQRGRLR